MRCNNKSMFLVLMKCIMLTFISTMFYFSTNITLSIINEDFANDNISTTKTDITLNNINNQKRLKARKQSKTRCYSVRLLENIFSKEKVNYFYNNNNNNMVINKENHFLDQNNNLLQEISQQLESNSYLSSSIFRLFNFNLSLCGKSWSVYAFAFTLGAFWNVKHLKKIGIV